MPAQLRNVARRHDRPTNLLLQQQVELFKVAVGLVQRFGDKTTAEICGRGGLNGDRTDARDGKRAGMKDSSAVEADRGTVQHQAVVGVSGEEGQAESAAQHRAGRDRGIEAETRAEVGVRVLQAGGRIINDGQCVEIKIRVIAILLVGSRENIVAQTQIEGEIFPDAPIILKIHGRLIGAVVRLDVEGLTHGDVLRSGEQLLQGGDIDPRRGRGWCRYRGREDKQSLGIQGQLEAEVATNQGGAHAHGLPSVNVGHSSGELRIVFLVIEGL